MVVIIGTDGFHKKVITAQQWKKPKPFSMLLPLLTFEVHRTTIANFDGNFYVAHFAIVV
jgi:hypothetical protein